MNRHTVRFAVLTALGAAMAASSPAAPQQSIPELANAEETTIPEVGSHPVPDGSEPERSLKQTVRARWSALKTKVEARHTDPGTVAAVEKMLSRVPDMVGPSRAMVQQSWYGENDLQQVEGRIDAVLTCLAMGHPAETCDLSTLLSPAAAAEKAGGTSPLATSVRLDENNAYIDLVQECTNPRFGRCGYGTRIDAHTASCVQLQQCRRGRPLPDGRVAELRGETRTAAGEAWAQVALDEHASIASFDRHLLELRNVGAPQELITAAERARADEIRHTELALELAGRFGADVSLGELPQGPPPATELLAVLLDVAEHGCIGETLSAAECAIALEQTEDPAVREVLQIIVQDESAHAALAWRTLAWGLPRLDEAGRAEVLEVFARARVQAAPACPSGIGVLGGEEAARARSWALRHVVGPALHAAA